MSNLKDRVLEGKLISPVVRTNEGRFAKFLRLFAYRNEPIQQNKIFVMTYDRAYSCNPAAICDEILRRDLPVDIVWVKQRNGADLDPRLKSKIRTVDEDTAAMYYEQATAKIWIDNALGCVWYGVPKREGQIYINTWHGSMGIKRLGGTPYWMKCARKCNAVTDYCVTNSAFEERVFRKTFWQDTEFLKVGHPRNDIFFDQDAVAKAASKVKKHFRIPQSANLFLYAPTFRDMESDGTYSMSWFGIDVVELRKALASRFGGEWYILIRLHFKNKDNSVLKLFDAYDWVVDACNYPEMYDLMASADAGCTDYSSWAYDYLLLKRPLFIYAPDREKYDTDRGFYYSLDRTPFAIAGSMDELSSAISDFEEAPYLEKVDGFLKAVGCYESGSAAAKTVDKIEELLQI